MVSRLLAANQELKYHDNRLAVTSLLVIPVEIPSEHRAQCALRS